MRILLLVISLLALLSSYVPASSLQRGYDKAAPFEAVRWSGGATECYLDGEWFELLSIDGVASSDLLEFCELTWPGMSQKRFGEDLVEAMSLMGSSPGSTVTLKLKDSDGVVSTRKDVSMTKQKRQLVWNYNDTGGLPISPGSIVMDLFKKPDPAYLDLAQFVEGKADSRKLAMDKAIQDLIALESALGQRFSYVDRTGVDLTEAVNAVVAGIGQAGDDLTVTTFALGIKKLLARFGDGHTRIGGLSQFGMRGYAPYLLADTTDDERGALAGGAVVAFHGDRSGYLNPEFPYLVALDGKPLELWLDAAKPYEALGSEHFQRIQALRNLRYVAHLRAALGLAQSGTIELTLASKDGERTKLTVPLSDSSRGIYGTWPLRDTQLLDGNLGYLRIERMASDDAFLANLTGAMETFAGTDGLVIDVRGNGGGSREALKTLLPYFIAPTEGPVVVNVAAYRTRPADDAKSPHGFLGNRGLYPAAWSGWSDAQRSAIDLAAKSFAPTWRHNPAHFSDWHFMVLGAGDVHYSAPVVLLTDSSCFSATDIFAGAFADRPGVTLVGEATGGGSGRSQSVSLPNTGLRISLSSMASFRPNGDLYEGLGIAPDHVVGTTADYWIGGADGQLDYATSLLKKQAAAKK